MFHGVRRAAAWLGSALLVTTLVAGCGSGDPASKASPRTSAATATASTTASDSVSATPNATVVADPAHAVPPPGPRTGALVPADLLVVSPDPLSAALVKKVRATTGVSGVAQVSLANISVEDRLLRVMAVDPATYRNFTPVQTADNLPLWQRVAGGEVAMDTSLQSTVAPDAQGYVTLGATKNAPKLHVGAWAPQITSAVDAVVNQRWGKSLDMVSGNVLLVTTTSVAPDRVVKPLQALIGSDASVQRLDVVARQGLDINAVQVAVPVGTVAQAVGRYTYRVAGGGRITPSSEWVRSHISTQQVPILGAVTCNNALFPQLKAALADVLAQGLASKIHSTAGCYYPRFIAGTTSISNHAFGLAIDINAPENGRGTAGQMDRSVVAIFEKWGFTWGGVWHYTDPMHFEMNRIVKPG
ncbi:M15 family metallopeptidase [Nocardioides sp. Kera G14]|uniref:M15 family metallopeptidase n=1 Tax=Nocardioides sp. Kera G14 TaxID=2884264 RepID=UPI001D10CE25|nr:M15 family metallopeptidase [Nocardioides sp. Kera G14]UDY23372.1 M15 family metallopeptidase [Nocardioides sp. Kera G14]